MNLYAESSAVLAWLLNEPESAIVQAALGNADRVAASDLTLVECDRVLIRAETLLALSATQTDERRTSLRTAASGWILLSLGAAIIDRARRPFPAEPIRTLDALHLSSVLSVAETLDDLAVLSLDRRIRSSARALGFGVLPVA